MCLLSVLVIALRENFLSDRYDYWAFGLSLPSWEENLFLECSEMIPDTSDDGTGGETGGEK
jgi:hypothetical protein